MAKQYTADKVKIPDMFWHSLEKLGVSRQDIARHTHLPASILLGHSAPDTEQFFSLWQSLPQLANDPAVGFLFSQTVHTTQLPPELFAASLASHYRDALQRLARYKSLCAPEIISIEEADGQCTVRIEWINTRNAIPDALVDTTFHFILGLGCANTGQPIQPDAVLLTRQPPSNANYLENYYRCKPRFEQPHNAIVLNSRLLDLPFETYNRALSEMILPNLDAELDKHNSQVLFSDQVKWVIEQFLCSGKTSITTVASELNVSVRTLQRRITSEGFTYKALLNQVRLEVAKQHLTNPDLSLNEISALLGYEDPNSFHRAFKTLANKTPCDWRDSHSNHSTPM